MDKVPGTVFIEITVVLMCLFGAFALGLGIASAIQKNRKKLKAASLLFLCVAIVFLINRAYVFFS